MSAGFERVRLTSGSLPQPDTSLSGHAAVDVQDLLIPENDEEAQGLEVLNRRGILPVIFEVASSVSPDRHAAVDIARRRYANGSIRTITAVRWAPQEVPIEGLISKAARIVLFPNDKVEPSVYFARVKQGKKGKEVDWRTPDPFSGEIERMPIDRKLLVAMSSATDKIEDGRKLVNGVFVGRPGVGVI